MSEMGKAMMGTGEAEASAAPSTPPKRDLEPAARGRVDEGRRRRPDQHHPAAPI